MNDRLLLRMKLFFADVFPLPKRLTNSATLIRSIRLAGQWHLWIEEREIYCLREIGLQLEVRVHFIDICEVHQLLIKDFRFGRQDQGQSPRQVS